jgi:predicted AAA+ superfamily ATPase
MIKTRLIMPPKAKSYFLFGPRGTGKSTWLKNHYKKHIYIDLLDYETLNLLQSHPDHLTRLIPTNYKEFVIIDEIQKIPQLLNTVHQLIEDRKIKFILTGSSSRKLKKEGVNLLAGRALVYHMHPLTVRELGKDFNLVHALDYGTLPSLLSENSPKKYLESYVQIYIKGEINSERLVRNIGSFSRFLEAATFSHGHELVVSNVAQECAVERKVVEDYFSILEDLLLCYRIPIFAKKAKRELLKKDKFFYFDPGIYQILRPKGPLDTPDDVRGAALENLVFNEIRALNHYFDWDLEIFHWRTKNKMEVDIILYGEKSFTAIEVKSASKVRGEYLNGLKYFKQDYPQAKLILLYGGHKEYFLDDVKIVPVEAFLIKPENYLFGKQD